MRGMGWRLRFYDSVVLVGCSERWSAVVLLCRVSGVNCFYFMFLTEHYVFVGCSDMLQPLQV